MLSEHRDKVKYRNSFGNQLFIFMTVVMKSNKVAIVRINTRSCDDRVSKIATDAFVDSIIIHGKYDYEIKLVYDDQFADLQKLKKEKEAQSR